MLPGCVRKEDLPLASPVSLPLTGCLYRVWIRLAARLILLSVSFMNRRHFLNRTAAGTLAGILSAHTASAAPAPNAIHKPSWNCYPCPLLP